MRGSKIKAAFGNAGGGSNNFMAGAVKHPGALREEAAEAGESTMAFAHSHDKGNSTTAKRSRLAETFAKFRPR